MFENKFTLYSIFHSRGLTQHVSSPTHISGDTLDLDITSDSQADNLKISELLHRGQVYRMPAPNTSIIISPVLETAIAFLLFHLFTVTSTIRFAAAAVTGK